MRLVMFAAAPVLLLAACHASVERTDAGDANRAKSVHIAMDDGGGKNQVSVNIPGFDAKLALPSVDLGKHVDLDGIKVAPDTIVHDIDVVGHGRDGDDGGGRVQLSFTNPRAPAALADYYRRSATDAGYDGVSASGGSVTGTKGGKRFALAVSPRGNGSEGTITMSGGD